MNANLIVSLSLLAAWAGSTSDGAASGLAWETKPESLALRQDGQVVWQFNYGARETKPCFHPVALAGGPVLSWDSPADHPWHRALWFSWKFINGVNYWEEDRQTGKAAGITEWQAPAIETRPNFAVRIVLPLTYRPAGGKAVLTEKRVVEITPPNADGSYCQDWMLTFTAQEQEVKLDRTPLPNEPGGQVFGGYAGLSMRFVRELKEIQVVTSEGPVSFKDSRFRGKAIGLDYSGVIDKRELGVAIMDHPDNLNSPSPWYAINEPVMHYFSPAVICYQPQTLKAGQNLTLRYRVIIHPGRWDAARLQQEARQFATPGAGKKSP